MGAELLFPSPRAGLGRDLETWGWGRERLRAGEGLRDSGLGEGPGWGRVLAGQGSRGLSSDAGGRRTAPLFKQPRSIRTHSSLPP